MVRVNDSLQKLAIAFTVIVATSSAAGLIVLSRDLQAARHNESVHEDFAKQYLASISEERLDTASLASRQGLRERARAEVIKALVLLNPGELYYQIEEADLAEDPIEFGAVYRRAIAIAQDILHEKPVGSFYSNAPISQWKPLALELRRKLCAEVDVTDSELSDSCLFDITSRHE